MSNERKGRLPLRSCIVCGSKVAKRDLIRVVRTPDGKVELDSTGKRSGRGAYLCKDTACWARAVKKGRLEHALKVNISEETWVELNVLARSLVSVN